MLLTTRQVGDRIIIGDNIIVKIISIKGKEIVIGIDAPKDILISTRNEQINSQGGKS